VRQLQRVERGADRLASPSASAGAASRAATPISTCLSRTERASLASVASGMAPTTNMALPAPRLTSKTAPKWLGRTPRNRLPISALFDLSWIARSSTMLFWPAALSWVPQYGRPSSFGAGQPVVQHAVAQRTPGRQAQLQVL